MVATSSGSNTARPSEMPSARSVRASATRFCSLIFPLSSSSPMSAAAALRAIRGVMRPSLGIDLPHDRVAGLVDGHELLDALFGGVEPRLGEAREPHPLFEQLERALERQIAGFQGFDDFPEPPHRIFERGRGLRLAFAALGMVLHAAHLGSPTDLPPESGAASRSVTGPPGSPESTSRPSGPDTTGTLKPDDKVTQPATGAPSAPATATHTVPGPPRPCWGARPARASRASCRASGDGSRARASSRVGRAAVGCRPSAATRARRTSAAGSKA